MTTLAGVYIALGLVVAAWVHKVATPTQASNAAAWALGLVGTLVLLLVALGVVVVR